MKTEYQVLEQLRDTIISNLNLYIDLSENTKLEHIDELNVKIDFPDVDSMRKNNMFLIQPDYVSIDTLSLSSDIATMNTTIFILSKGAKTEELIKRVFGYYSAIYLMLKANQGLNGFIDFIKITDMDYYPSITPTSTTCAIEVSLSLQWTKEF